MSQYQARVALILLLIFTPVLVWLIYAASVLGWWFQTGYKGLPVGVGVISTCVVLVMLVLQLIRYSKKVQVEVDNSGQLTFSNQKEPAVKDGVGVIKLAAAEISWPNDNWSKGFGRAYAVILSGDTKGMVLGVFVTHEFAERFASVIQSETSLPVLDESQTETFELHGRKHFMKNDQKALENRIRVERIRTGS
ncbi:MAG: hypothetical protein JJ974_00855 [Phycisphaerales bacterium]|nr:hypothetical protein [Phycisphaerales bacterium]